MRRALPHSSSHKIHIRDGTPADIDALYGLENLVFETDRMSRPSLRRLLVSPSAAVMVAEADRIVAGVAVILFRTNSRIARLYSIAVAPNYTGRGIASALIAAAERATRKRDGEILRLEVHEKNHGAIRLYRKSGYQEFGRHHHYYEDRGHALRFEKRLASVKA